MERRGFLKVLIGGVVVAAAAQTFPFRVYSFPSHPMLLSFEPEITGWVQYRFHMKVTLPPYTTRQIRYIDGIGAVENGVPVPAKHYKTYVLGKEGLWT